MKQAAGPARHAFKRCFAATNGSSTSRTATPPGSVNEIDLPRAWAGTPPATKNKIAIRETLAARSSALLETILASVSSPQELPQHAPPPAVDGEDQRRGDGGGNKEDACRTH